MSTGSRTSRTANSGPRKNTKGNSDKRTAAAFVLLFLLPPVGLFYMWRSSVFRKRGRMFLTLTATVEMTVILLIALPAQKIPGRLPVASVPVAATVVPEGRVVSALSNIDQLLADQQAAEADLTVTPEPTNAADRLAEQEAILNTTVYSVYSNKAKYYHAVEICGTQTNRRALTVREAMQENMGACPNCNPPVYTG